jgi:dihydropteroate synthase
MFNSSGKPLLMGILNVTPDSFSDGGRFNTITAALSQAEKMLIDGADIIDIGGESTRPYSLSVSSGEQVQRVIPIVKAIR